MDFIINGQKLTPPAPKMKDWRTVQQFKTERCERAEALKTLLDSTEGKKPDEVAQIFDDIDKKATLNKMLNIDTKTHILSNVFEIDFEDVEITEVHTLYAKYEDWIDGLISGRLAKCPNAETQAEG